MSRSRSRSRRSPMEASVLHWGDPRHCHCVVCAPYVEARALRIAQALQEVHAASLRAQETSGRESRPTKQETPGPARPEVSTAHILIPQEARAARAQSDTHG